MADFYINARVKVDTASVQEQLNKIKTPTIKTDSSSVKQLGNEFVTTTAKVAKFAASTAVIGAVTSAVREAIDVTKEYDSTLTEFKKVSDLTGQSLDNYAQKLGELGTTVARTRTEMVAAATEFKKSGFSDEDAATLAQVASMYQNVADEALSASDSASYIISQMKAFNITAEDASSIIDKTNAVSNDFAVSSSNISSALTKTSSALGAYGNTIDETIALVTAGTEIMTNQAGKVGRGLRTIGANIASLASSAGTLEYNVNGVAKSISLIDENTGDIKNTYQVLSEIAQSYDQMSKSEQTALTLQLAGKNQIDVLTSVLSNFDTAIDAVTTSLNSNGSAAEENAKYLDSLEGKYASLKSQFEQLVLGDGGFNDFLKNITDTGTALLKFANSDIGQTILQLIALESAVVLASKGVSKLITSFKASEIGSLIIEITQASNATIGFTSVLKALTTTWFSSPLGIATTVVAGIYAIGKAIDYLIVTEEEYNDKIEEHAQKMDEASSEYADTTKQINDLQSQIDSLNETIAETETLDVVDEEELQDLKEQTAELEHQLAILQEIQQEKAKEKQEEAEAIINEGRTDISTNAGGGLLIESKTSLESLQDATKEIQNYTNVLEEAKQRKAELESQSSISSKEQQELYNLNNSIKVYSEHLEDAKSRAADYAEIVLEGYQNLDESLNPELYAEVEQALEDYGIQLEENADATDESTDSIQNSEEVLQSYADELGITTDELEANAEAAGMTVEQYYEASQQAQELADKQEQLNDQLDNLQSALDTAQTALDEYNSTGSLSIDTFQSLLNISPEYLAALQNENGQISLNKDTLANLTEQLKLNYIESLKQAAVQDIVNLALGETQNLSTLAQQAISQFGNNVATAGNQAATAAGQMSAFASSVLAAATATSGQTLQGDKLNQANAIINSYKKIGDSISKIKVSTVSATKATSGGTSATKRNTSATKSNSSAKNSASDANNKLADSIEKTTKKLEKQKDALEEQLDDLKDYSDELEDVFDAVLNRLDDEIDKLEDAQDASDEYYENRLDELDKLRDSTEEYWDNLIDKQEESNDATNEAIELQEKLNNLNKAKSTQVRTFKNGQWTYGVDEEAVAEAQKELDDYYRDKQQEQAVEDLETQKDNALNDIDKQIEQLEAQKEASSEYYEEQIQNLKDYQKQVEALRDAYEDLQDTKLLNKYLKNGDIFDLAGLKKVAAEYQKTQQSIEKITNQVDKLSDAIKKLNDLSSDVKDSDSKVSSSYVNSQVDKIVAGTRASGDSHINQDGAYIVGENPNKEIVLGSKLNNGTIMNLTRGSGVVNSQSTRTLAGLINSVGKFRSSNFGAGNGTVTNNSTNSNKIMNFNIEHINVETPDGQGFVDYLQNFAIQMTQNSYK